MTGLYELFISKIDITHEDEKVNNILINSLDDLKGRLAKVLLVFVVFLASPILRLFTALKFVRLVPALRLGALIRKHRVQLLKLILLSRDTTVRLNIDQRQLA